MRSLAHEMEDLRASMTRMTGTWVFHQDTTARRYSGLPIPLHPTFRLCEDTKTANKATRPKEEGTAVFVNNRRCSPGKCYCEGVSLLLRY